MALRRPSLAHIRERNAWDWIGEAGAGCDALGLAWRQERHDAIQKLICNVSPPRNISHCREVERERVVRTESFEEFAIETSSMLYRTAWLLTGDKHASEDLVQETFARVFPRWGRGALIDNPAGYARTALVREFLRGRRRRSSTEMPTHPLPDHAVDSDRSAGITLEMALAQLPTRDRAVLVLRYYDDRSVRDVSRDLGMTESAVRTCASRAIAKLREQLGADFLVPLP
jgi:RNA polymerase sigma-70 factor (sigma-E family)